MASLALTKEDMAVFVADRYKEQFDTFEIDGYWTQAGSEIVQEILRYYDDGKTTVIRSGVVEKIERDGKSLGLIVNGHGFIPCKAKVVNLD